MPFAVIKSVHEVSSEDPNFLSQNLLTPLPSKSWRTKTPGQTKAYVIFELNTSACITGFDIGNEHSSFIEVLVGKERWPQNEFKNILHTCTFMTPHESASSSNPNRVRFFSKESLVPEICNEKWKFVKVICTQPFNKHVCYGLSIFKIHVSVEDSSNEKHPAKAIMPQRDQLPTDKKQTQRFGKFSLREDSPDSDASTSANSNLFGRWKQFNNEREMSTDESIVIHAKQGKPTEKLSTIVKVKSTENETKTNVSFVRDRNRNDVMFDNDKDEDIASEKKKRFTQLIAADKDKLEEVSNSKKHKKILKESVESVSPKVDKVEPKLKKRLSPNQLQHSGPSSKIRKVNANVYRPFNELLKGVVLVISGIQNPDRAEIRRKALALGAKYKADWDNGCTHLICAFKNTPKYNQIKGKGKIVTRIWIEKCFALRKYLPWRRYALDDTESEKPESDTEILDNSLEPKDDSNSSDGKNILALYDLDSDNENTTPKKQNQNTTDVSADEDSTDEEDYLKTKFVLHSKCKNFLRNYKFFLNNVTNKLKLENAIHSFGGQVTNSISDAHYIISDEALNEKNLTGLVVKPIWIEECHKTNTKIPITKYLL